MKTFFDLMAETKSAPKGYHFTRSGKLRKGDADADGDGGAKLRSDPLDKTRSKIPPLPEKFANPAQQAAVMAKLKKDGKYKAESIEKMPHSQLKFFATKKVPHGSYTRAEIDNEHKRRQKTAGAEYQNAKPSVNERTLTKGEMNKREKLAKDLPDAEFKKRYGKDWMSVKMGTATNMAKDEAKDYTVQVTGSDGAGTHKVKAKSQDHAHELVMKKIGRSKLPKHMQPKTRIMGEAHDPNNPDHVMKVLSPTKNSVEGIAAIKKKFGVDHKKASDMLDKALDHQLKKEAVDPDETGGEAETHMAMNQVKQMRHYLDGIERMVKSEGDMEEWIQNKMTKATDYLKSVYGYKTGSQNESVNEISQGMKDRYLRFAKSSRVNAPKDYQNYKAMGMPHGMKRAADTARKRDRGIKLASEAMTFAVNVEGLPQMFLNGNSPGEIKQNLRKMFKQPSMIQSVKRVTPHDVKKVFRMKAQGKDED